VKSLAVTLIAWRCAMARLVIWQRITSSPGSAVITRAGRRLVALRSENGNGMTTTSPFTNLPMQRLPLVDPSPCARPTRQSTVGGADRRRPDAGLDRRRNRELPPVSPETDAATA